MARAAGWELGPGARSQEAAGGREMLPPGLEEETLHHTGTDGLGTGPWMHNPKARASLRIPHHPVPPGAGISICWDRASMHYLQLHQPITLKQLHQHRGCWNALFCIDHNDTSQHYEPLRYFRPSTSEVTECQQAAEIKFAFSIKDWGVEGVRKKPQHPKNLFGNSRETLYQPDLA